MGNWLLTGWKTILGMVLVIFGEGLKIVFPSVAGIGEVIVQFGAVIGGGGLVHKLIRGGK